MLDENILLISEKWLNILIDSWLRDRYFEQALVLNGNITSKYSSLPSIVLKSKSFSWNLKSPAFLALKNLQILSWAMIVSRIYLPSGLKLWSSALIYSLISAFILLTDFPVCITHIAMLFINRRGSLNIFKKSLNSFLKLAPLPLKMASTSTQNKNLPLSMVSMKPQFWHAI